MQAESGPVPGWRFPINSPMAKPPGGGRRFSHLVRRLLLILDSCLQVADLAFWSLSREVATAPAKPTVVCPLFRGYIKKVCIQDRDCTFSTRTRRLQGEVSHHSCCGANTDYSLLWQAELDLFLVMDSVLVQVSHVSQPEAF